MIQVSDIYEDARNIVGTCDDPTLFRRISEAVEALANKGDFDPLLGTVEICTSDKCVTLPREVENVMAVNINGRPSIGRDRWFNFHLNGPGDHHSPAAFRPVIWSWQDGAESPVFRELRSPSKLIAFVSNAADQGTELRVYGYDTAGLFIRTLENGVWVDGYRVPTIFGFAMPESGAPIFARIIRVKKAVTAATIRLTSLDISSMTGTLVGQYEYDETDPLYRRIILQHEGLKSVNIAFRRRVFKVTSQESLIPLHSTLAILEMLRAIKGYADDNLVLGQGHEATADRFISEEQATRSPPVNFPMQINPVGSIVNNYDQMD